MNTYDIIQRSKDWYLIRKGRFTASEIIDICGTPLAFDTAVYEKAYEAILQDETYLNLMEEQNRFPAKPLLWGMMYEDEARDIYESRTGREVTQIGFKEYTKDAGGSPDGLVLRDNGQIEIKCPLNGSNHIKYSNINDIKELLTVSRDGKKYYYQMQANMLFSQSDYCDFVTYDPRCTEFLCISIKRCYPDKAIQQQIKEQIEKASEAKHRIIKSLIDKAINKQSVFINK